MAEKYSIYAGEPMAAVLAAHDDVRSGRINQVCADYIDICRDHMPTLTRAEWCAVMDATNGLHIAQSDSATRRFLWAEVADFAGLGEKWGINQEALAQSLRAMSTANLVAVVEASRVFWLHADRGSDEGLKLAGVRIQPAPQR